MIPILYTADENRFVTNGIGRLADCTRCIVTEERNGIYECEFDYPLTGVHFDDIDFGRIVGCTHDDKHDIQPFVIYSRTIPDLNGVVTFNAYHISYKLNEIVAMPFTATSVADAMSKIVPNSVNDNPFTFWTDKTTVGAFNSPVPRSIRGMLGGEENSLLDVYGAGDYEFDRFDVKLYAHRGVDSDVEIRYSKNLTDLSEKIDDGDSYNAIVPYWTDSEGNLVMLPEVVLVYSGYSPVIAYLTDHNLIIIRTETDEPIEVAYTELRAVPYDMSDDFDDMPTVNQLRNAARTKFENSDAWLPEENLKIDFVQLWQTEEFKDYAAAQRVSLCDTVSVYYPAAGIRKVKQRVVKVVYNVLLDRYDSIELGKLQNSLGQAIRKDILQEVPTNSMMDAAIRYATDLIRGGLGGYVVMTPGPNGYPQEILIMDTPDVSTAVNVWRFNQGGLGHSSTGYDGPFSDIALTQDGKINASMITTGILNANVIQAGTITDASGKNYWDLESGQFQTKQGIIGGFTITDTELDYSDSSLIVKASPDGFSTSKQVSSSLYLGSSLAQGVLDLLGSTSSLDSLDSLFRIFAGFVGSSSRFIIHDEYNNFDLCNYRGDQQLTDWEGDFRVWGDLSCTGAKPREVLTQNYNVRRLYCYETPSPVFGDIGEAVLDESGDCYVDIDDIFSETIASQVEYQVFLQKEGEGDCWISDKTPRFFVISGTPGLKVAWELKAKQRDYEYIRLEQSDLDLDVYSRASSDDMAIDNYITEQEELLYG